MSDLTAASLSKKKKTELVELCRAKGVPFSGTKDVLISRILGEAAPSKKKAKDSIQPTMECKAITSARKNMSVHVLVKNSFGRFEHRDTGFIFDRESKKVIGKQDEDEMVNLSMSDLAVCKEYNFQVDETKVIKGFASEKNGNRLGDLERYMDDQDEDAETDEE
jgi:SAP domain-containing new25